MVTSPDDDEDDFDFGDMFNDTVIYGQPILEPRGIGKVKVTPKRNIKVKVTLPVKFVPPNVGMNQGIDVKVTYPTRVFEGDIKWYVSERGVLSIMRTDGIRAESFISFAHGQWVSVEDVSDGH